MGILQYSFLFEMGGTRWTCTVWWVNISRHFCLFLSRFVFFLLGKQIHSTKPKLMNSMTNRVWGFLLIIISSIFYYAQNLVCLICKSLYWVVLFCKYLKFYQDQCRGICQDVLGTSHYLRWRLEEKMGSLHFFFFLVECGGFEMSKGST